jgi:hypothetical protein
MMLGWMELHHSDPDRAEMLRLMDQTMSDFIAINRH